MTRFVRIQQLVAVKAKTAQKILCDSGFMFIDAGDYLVKTDLGELVVLTEKEMADCLPLKAVQQILDERIEEELHRTLETGREV